MKVIVESFKGSNSPTYNRIQLFHDVRVTLVFIAIHLLASKRWYSRGTLLWIL